MISLEFDIDQRGCEAQLRALESTPLTEDCVPFWMALIARRRQLDYADRLASVHAARAEVQTRESSSAERILLLLPEIERDWYVLNDEFISQENTSFAHSLARFQLEGHFEKMMYYYEPLPKPLPPRSQKSRTRPMEIVAVVQHFREFLETKTIIFTLNEELNSVLERLDTNLALLEFFTEVQAVDGFGADWMRKPENELIAELGLYHPVEVAPIREDSLQYFELYIKPLVEAVLQKTKDLLSHRAVTKDFRPVGSELENIVIDVELAREELSRVYKLIARELIRLDRKLEPAEVKMRADTLGILHQKLEETYSLLLQLKDTENVAGYGLQAVEYLIAKVERLGQFSFSLQTYLADV